MKKYLILILLLIVCSSGTGVYLGSGAGITKGLWHLDGNSNDASGNSRNGTDTDIAYGLTYGKFGQGASFNGSSSIISFNSIASLGDRTLSAWIKTTNSSTSQCIFSQYRFVSSTDAQYTAFLIKTNKLYYETDSEPTNDGTSDMSVSNISNDVWTHVAMTISGSALKLYINGVLEKSANLYYQPSFTPSTNGTTIGAYKAFWSTPLIDWFNGNIDEIVIENVVWSQETIKKYYTYSKGRFL